MNVIEELKRRLDTLTNARYEDFEDPEQTIDTFGLGLSNECRLRECRRGNVPYKWTVETLEDGHWQEHSTTALLVFPFWRKRQIRYLQNRLLCK